MKQHETSYGQTTIFEIEPNDRSVELPLSFNTPNTTISYEAKPNTIIIAKSNPTFGGHYREPQNHVLVYDSYYGKLNIDIKKPHRLESLPVDYYGSRFTIKESISAMQEKINSVNSELPPIRWVSLPIEMKEHLEEYFEGTGVDIKKIRIDFYDKNQNIVESNYDQYGNVYHIKDGKAYLFGVDSSILRDKEIKDSVYGFPNGYHLSRNIIIPKEFNGYPVVVQLESESSNELLGYDARDSSSIYNKRKPEDIQLYLEDPEMISQIKDLVNQDGKHHISVYQLDQPVSQIDQCDYVLMPCDHVLMRNFDDNYESPYYGYIYIIDEENGRVLMGTTTLSQAYDDQCWDQRTSLMHLEIPSSFNGIPVDFIASLRDENGQITNFCRELMDYNLISIPTQALEKYNIETVEDLKKYIPAFNSRQDNLGYNICDESSDQHIIDGNYYPLTHGDDCLSYGMIIDKYSDSKTFVINTILEDQGEYAGYAESKDYSLKIPYEIDGMKIDVQSSLCNLFTLGDLPNKESLIVFPEKVRDEVESLLSNSDSLCDFITNKTGLEFEDKQKFQETVNEFKKRMCFSYCNKDGIEYGIRSGTNGNELIALPIDGIPLDPKRVASQIDDIPVASSTVNLSLGSVNVGQDKAADITNCSFCGSNEFVKKTRK